MKEALPSSEVVKIACRGRRGFPDVLVWILDLPTIYIEFKSPKWGKLSKQQEWWIERAKLLSQEMHVCDSYEKADALVHSFKERFASMQSRSLHYRRRSLSRDPL